jgi:acetyl esterase/lipase
MEMCLRVMGLAVVLAAGSGLVGCGSADDAAAPSPGTEPFLEDLQATLVLPADTADDLAARGAAVVTVTYRTSDSGEFFPVPVEDVACGLAYAVDAVAGLDVSQVVLGGHSVGANMAALVALAPEDFAGSDCPYEAAAPDALIGISGEYDLNEEGSRGDAYRFFGGPNMRDLSTWDEGNPWAFAEQRPDVPVLLLHGTADDMVPITFTEDFAAALTDGGHQVTTDYIEGADHFTVLAPQMAGPVIADWLGTS